MRFSACRFFFSIIWASQGDVSLNLKLFELVVEGRFSTMWIFKRSRVCVRSICLGKARVSWLLASIKDFILEGTKVSGDALKLESQLFSPSDARTGMAASWL